MQLVFSGCGSDPSTPVSLQLAPTLGSLTWHEGDVVTLEGRLELPGAPRGARWRRHDFVARVTKHAPATLPGLTCGRLREAVSSSGDLIINAYIDDISMHWHPDSDHVEAQLWRAAQQHFTTSALASRLGLHSRLRALNVSHTCSDTSQRVGTGRLSTLYGRGAQESDDAFMVLRRLLYENVACHVGRDEGAAAHKFCALQATALWPRLPGLDSTELLRLLSPCEDGSTPPDAGVGAGAADGATAAEGTALQSSARAAPSHACLASESSETDCTGALPGPSGQTVSPQLQTLDGSSDAEASGKGAPSLDAMTLTAAWLQLGRGDAGAGAAAAAGATLTAPFDGGPACDGLGSPGASFKSVVAALLLAKDRSLAATVPPPARAAAPLSPPPSAAAAPLGPEPLGRSSLLPTHPGPWAPQRVLNARAAAGGSPPPVRGNAGARGECEGSAAAVEAPPAHAPAERSPPGSPPCPPAREAATASTIGAGSTPGPTAVWCALALVLGAWCVGRRIASSAGSAARRVVVRRQERRLVAGGAPPRCPPPPQSQCGRPVAPPPAAAERDVAPAAHQQRQRQLACTSAELPPSKRGRLAKPRGHRLEAAATSGLRQGATGSSRLQRGQQAVPGVLQGRTGQQRAVCPPGPLPPAPPLGARPLSSLSKRPTLSSPALPDPDAHRAERQAAPPPSAAARPPPPPPAVQSAATTAAPPAVGLPSAQPAAAAAVPTTVPAAAPPVQGSPGEPANALASPASSGGADGSAGAGPGEVCVCLVCLDRPWQHGFLHGGSVHIGVCGECLAALQAAAAGRERGARMSCPVCRGEVERPVALFT